MNQPERVGLVTGCSSGIGYELLRPLLGRGDIVYASLRNLAPRRKLFSGLEAEYGDRLRLLELDVADRDDIAGAVGRVKQDSGRLDYLVNNAGFGVFGPLEEAGESEVRAQLEVNFFGALFLTQAALPMLRQSRGKIIGVSSIAGAVGFPFTSLYCSSKFALEGLFEALSHEMAPLGVGVALVLPGGHRTSFDANRKNVLRRDSVYQAAAEDFLRRLAARPDDGRAPSDHVVRAIVRLLERPSMPLRTFVGTDAKAIHYLHSLLPQFIFQPLLRLALRRRNSRAGNR